MLIIRGDTRSLDYSSYGYVDPSVLPLLSVVARWTRGETPRNFDT